MGLIVFAIYVYAGAKANSFLKHYILKMQTVYVFNVMTFITEKIIMAALLGWVTIPVALVARAFGVGRTA